MPFRSIRSPKDCQGLPIERTVQCSQHARVSDRPSLSAARTAAIWVVVFRAIPLLALVFQPTKTHYTYTQFGQDMSRISFFRWCLDILVK
ncbi:UNVERIFIED_CONTAM: hypothetical protein Sradi_5077300 [Sesamum radiatum]|uniref:Uncharacterized protein n=1 Tax=Sesamum radiatum TaxID=300843 RepID=A0AAW2M0R9_SESRA